jgi:hypothetical protein
LSSFATVEFGMHNFSAISLCEVPGGSDITLSKIAIFSFRKRSFQDILYVLLRWSSRLNWNAVNDALQNSCRLSLNMIDLNGIINFITLLN